MTTTPHRKLSFSNLDEALAEAERLAAADHFTTGHHGFAQILNHLAVANDMVTGKVIPPKLPFLLRLLMPLVRSKILNRPIKPGFKLPKKSESFFWPNRSLTVDEALAAFRQSVERYQQKGPLPVHPIFGKATREQIDLITLRHAAMHLGFVHTR